MERLAMNTAFFPKVSIIIPVYNGANYMREAIDSALAQTYTNIEVVVVNDGSRDDGATREVALSYGDRIRYIEKENGGVSSALNRGIREMTGEYFSWLSHDDRYEPDKIARQVSHLAEIEDRDKLIAMCGGFYLDKDSKRLRDMDFHFKSGAVNTGMEVLDYLLTHGVLDMCCLLIPRETFEDCAYFHEDLRYNQDALILYQIFSRGYRMVTFTEERDVAYRLHVAQTSKTRRDLLIRDSNEAAKIIAPTFAALNTRENKFLRRYAKRHARQACKEATKTCLRIGRETHKLRGGDVLYIRCWLALGYVRQMLKRLYHKLRF
jgi:glycosyltransferase involved in cell wall biosynthesis